MGLRIDQLPAAILADLDASDTLLEIQDTAEALPADQSKKLTLGILRDFLAAAAFAVLAITGDFSIATNKFTVASASGNTVVAGTLGITGNVAVNTNKFTIAAASGNTLCAGTMTITGAFGCNTKAAQGAFASGGALNAYGTGAFGLDSGANMSALHGLVVAIRAALVANGIMS